MELLPQELLDRKVHDQQIKIMTEAYESRIIDLTMERDLFRDKLFKIVHIPNEPSAENIVTRSNNRPNQNLKSWPRLRKALEDDDKKNAYWKDKAAEGKALIEEDLKDKKVI